MLRIGFDAKRAFLNRTGLGNYSRSVISSLSEYFPGNEYLLYTPKVLNDALTEPLVQAPNISLRKPRIPLFRAAWRSRFVVSQLQRDRLDIYHGLSHELPAGIRRTGIRTVVTIHDLIFLRYPQYYKAADRKIYELKFRYACKYADMIVAISEQTKRDIVHFFGTDPARIRVIYQSCDAQFTKTTDPALRQKVKERYNLPDQYLLYVGTIEDRKNLMLVAQALKQTDIPIPLIVVGRQTAYAEKVKNYLRENDLEARVSFLRDVPFSELPALYQLATVFVYPSEFEGFGIPVLEALYSGVPVIAATGSCLEEAGGPSSMYIAPRDHLALAGAINKLIAHPEQRASMTDEGRKYAEGFTEKIQAENLMRLYLDLTGK